MQRIGSCLWFDGQAEEAANFYVSIFKNSRIVRTSRYLEGTPGPVGTVMAVEFILDGAEFTALNGGPQFKFTPAISFMVHCETQAEVDHYWKKLTQGGEEVQCGWLTDKYGVSWQIIPNVLLDMMCSSDKAAAQRATAAMLKMKKLDIAVMQRAYDGK